MLNKIEQNEELEFKTSAMNFEFVAVRCKSAYDALNTYSTPLNI